MARFKRIDSVADPGQRDSVFPFLSTVRPQLMRATLVIEFP